MSLQGTTTDSYFMSVLLQDLFYSSICFILFFYVPMAKMFSITVQNANDSERRYSLIRSQMNVHKVNVTSLPADQLLHVDINMFYPDTSLRLFPITIFLQ